MLHPNNDSLDERQYAILFSFINNVHLFSRIIMHTKRQARQTIMGFNP
jgi:hypothetical protein